MRVEPHDGISVLGRRGRQPSLSLCSLPCEDTVRRQRSEPGSGPFPELDHTSALISDFPASRL